MVLHHEANQSQVRDMDGKVKGTVPLWVKAWTKETNLQTDSNHTRYDKVFIYQHQLIPSILLSLFLGYLTLLV